MSNVINTDPFKKIYFLIFEKRLTWSSSMEVFFIEQVFSLIHLWCPKNSNYKNRYMRRQGFQTILIELKGKFPKECSFLNSDDHTHIGMLP